MEDITYEIAFCIENGDFQSVREEISEMCPQELCKLAEDIQLLMLTYTDDRIYERYRRLLEDILSCAGNRKGTIQRILREIDQRQEMNNGEEDIIYPEEIENG